MPYAGPMTETAATAAAHTLAAIWWRPANVVNASGPLVANWRCSCGATGRVTEGKSPKAKMTAARAQHAQHEAESAA